MGTYFDHARVNFSYSIPLLRTYFSFQHFEIPLVKAPFEEMKFTKKKTFITFP